MPIYLLHGFRWPRPSIRIHTIMHDLSPVSPEYISPAPCTTSLLSSLLSLHPSTLTPLLPSLRFIEQYDPADTSHAALSQPWAYVADVVEEGKLSLSVEEGMARGAGVGAERWEKMCELRDLLAPGERIGWWVVWNGDVERGFPREVGGAGVEESGEGEERVGEGDIGEDGGAAGGGGQAGEGMREEEQPKRKGTLRKMFGGKG